MKRIVVGIGEALWDLLPNNHRIGGAPCNFSYHASQLGAKSIVISKIGQDDLGAIIISHLNKVGVDSNFLQQDKHHPTGAVNVQLNLNGAPTYEICKEVAWDYLEMTREMKSLAPLVHAICFGSLAQRNPQACMVIMDFLKLIPKDSLRIFDVNLRPPFYNKKIIEASIKLANVLKLSDEELPVIGKYFDLSGNVDSQLSQLLSRFDLNIIAYTRGKSGSILLSKTERDEYPGNEIQMVDSVGAGDSFTATVCMGMLNKFPLTIVNELANRIASFVCTQNGATPVLPENLKEKFI